MKKILKLVLLRMEQGEIEDLKAIKDTLDSKDFRVTPVFKDLLEHKVILDFKELEVIQVSRVLLDFKEKKEKEYQSTKIQMFLLII